MKPATTSRMANVSAPRKVMLTFSVTAATRPG